AEERTAWGYGVTRIPFTHDHLIGTVVVAGRSHGDGAAHGPEAQQPDAKFTLKPGHAVLLQPAFNGIADVRGDVVEVRTAVFIARHAIPVVSYRKKMLAVFSAARDRDGAGLRIDAVLHQVRNGFKRIAL